MKELVKTTVEKYGSRDPFEILEAIGAIVYFQPIKGDVRGFNFRSDDGTPIVCLSDTLSAPERLRVAAHELGHVIAPAYKRIQRRPSARRGGGARRGSIRGVTDRRGGADL